LSEQPDQQPQDPNGFQGISTRAVHAGEPRRQYMDSITTPIVMTSSYTFTNMTDVLDYVTKKVDRFEYGRYGNPTTATVIKKLRALENAEDAEVFDCGMTSVSCTLLGLMKNGEHLVITDDAYKKTLMFCEKVLPRFGIGATVVKMGDYDQMEDALKKNPGTKLVLSESPTNPYLNIADMDILVRPSQGGTICAGRRHHFCQPGTTSARSNRGRRRDAVCDEVPGRA
jgi:cystathionine gamma-synthase